MILAFVAERLQICQSTDWEFFIFLMLWA